MVEPKRHADAVGEDNAVPVDGPSVEECHVDFASELESGIRCPSATTHCRGVGDVVGLAVVVEEHEVGEVAGAYESTAVDAEKCSWRMAHLVDNGLDSHEPFADHVHHDG